MNSHLLELYNAFAPMVFRRCMAILKNEEEAHDGVQEVFSRLVSRDVSRMESPTAYLWKMATNYSLNRLERERRAVSFPETDLSDHRSDTERDAVRAVFLETLFAKVPRSTRELAWYRWVDGLTWEETALASGLSVSGVRKRLAQFVTAARKHKENVS